MQNPKKKFFVKFYTTKSWVSLVFNRRESRFIWKINIINFEVSKTYTILKWEKKLR